MKYEEFKETMSRKLAEIIAPIGHMEVHEVTLRKVNCNTDAISIIKGEGDEKSGPTFRFDEMYGYYVNVANCNFSRTLDYFMVQILMAFQKADEIEEHITIHAKDWDDLKLTMQIINAEKNEELLATVPYRMVDGIDLAIIYRAVVAIDAEGGFDSAIVTHNLAEMFGKSEEELYEKAKATMEEILPCDIGSCDGVFCIVTNRAKSLGAIYGFDLNVLSNIAEMMEDDLHILPSSIHECFVIPACIREVEELTQFITDANKTVVSEEEFLSNNPYLYLRKENKIVMA